MKTRTTLTLLAVAVLALLAVQPAHAATYYKADNTTALNATGSWTTAVVPGSGDIAEWNSTVTVARSAAIGDNLSWQGIKISNPVTGTQTIAATATKTLTLGASGIDMTAATVDLTIASQVALGAAQAWDVQTGRTLTVSGTVANGGNLLTVQGAGNTTVSGVIGNGAGGVTKTGTGTLTLSAANTYTGTTTVNAGTLTLSGSGTINDSTAIALNGGNLSLVNTAQVNRVNDAASITSNGGTITYTNTSGANVYSETIGSVALTSGQLNIVEATNQAGAGSQTLTINTGGITRSGGTNTSAVTFSAASTGPQASGNKNMIVVSGAGTTSGWVNAATSNPIIGPWATVGTAAGTQTDYAVYNGGYVVAGNTAASGESTWSDNTKSYTLANASGSAANGKFTASRTANSVRYNTTTTNGTVTNAGNGTVDCVTLTGHTFANGDVITIGNGGGSNLQNTVLYVVNTGFGGNANNFQVSTTPGGAGVDFSNTTVPAIAAGITLPSGFNLGTYGILNAQSTTLTIGTTTSTPGSITLPTAAAENLYVTAGSGAIAIDAPIIDNGVGNALTLVKNGSGSLILQRATTFTGGFVVNAGNLTLNNAHSFTSLTINVPITLTNNTSAVDSLGAVGGTVTVNATTNLNFSGNTTFQKSFVLNNNAMLNVTNGNNLGTITGAVTGSGGVGPQNAGSIEQRTLSLTSTANTFTGPITLNWDSGNNSTISVNSLWDGPGAGAINLFANANGEFMWGSGATTPLTLNYRQFVITSTTAGANLYIKNANTNAANTITVNTDLLITGTGAKTLTLAGSNTGINAFAGKIADGPGAVVSLTKADAGTWVLSGVNTYTGTTTISAGTLSVSSLQNAGVNSPIGAYATAGAGGISLGAATLKYTGGTATTDRGFTTTGNATIDVPNGVTLTLGACSVGGNVTASGGGTVSLGAVTMTAAKALNTTTGNLTIASLAMGANNVIFDTSTGTGYVITITGPVTGSGTVTKTGATSGTLTLSGPNTYTGQTILQRGSLVVSSLNSVVGGSVSSSLGAPTTAPNGTIKMGNTTNTTPVATLVYTGTGEITDRVIDLTGTTAGATLDQSGTGLLKFTSAFTATGNGAKTLTLQGSTAGTGEIAAAIVDNSSSNKTSLTKAGTGTWTLSGNNTYTGATTVSAGTLKVTGSTAAGSAVAVNAGGALTVGGAGVVNGTVAVNAGGALGGTGTINGAVTAAVGTATALGGVINLVDGAAGTLTLGSTLTFNGTSAFPNGLYFDLGTSAGTNDRITATGVVAVTNAGGAVINLKPTVNGGTIGNGAYTLVTGSGITNPGNFALATSAAFGKTFALSDSGASKQVTVADATAGPAAAFWKGGTNPWTTAANWNDAVSGGNELTAIPSVGTNVTFATTSPAPANLATNTLSADFEINSLTFNAAAGGVTIGGTNRLTLDATDANGNTAGNGITASNTSGTNTISANVGLGGSQTWTVATGGTLAVSGAITDFGSGFSLTKSGSGALTLSGTNTYSGGLTLSTGTLNINNAAALGSGPFTITGGTTINNSTAADITASAGNPAQNWNGDFTFTGTKSLNLGTGAVTMSSNRQVTVTANTLTVAGPIGDGGNGYSLTKAGNGTLLLSSANTYSGGTNLNAGTILLSNGAALGTGTVTINSGTTLGASTSGDVTISGISQYILNGNFATYNSTKNINFGTAPFKMAAALSLTVCNGVTIGGAITDTAGGNTLNALDITGVSVGGVGYGLTFSAPITLRATQTVSGKGASITGAIGDGSNGYGITLSGGACGVSLQATNTFTGPITIGSGCSLTLGTGDLGTTGSISPTCAIINNGTLRLGLSGKTYTQGTDFNSVISGTGNITMGGHTNTLVLNGVNTFSGSITLSGDGADKLQFNSIKNVNGGASALGNPSSAANGTINLGGYTITYTGSGDSSDRIFGLTGNGTIKASGTTTVGSPLEITSAISASGGSRTLTLGGTGAGKWSGNINNSGGNITSLTKADAGTWILTGANGYTGATNVNVGKLLVNGNQSAASGAVTVASGATLGGGGTIGGTVTVNSGGILAPGASTGTLTVNSATTINGTFSVDVEADGDCDLLAVTGNLILGGSSYLSIVDTLELVWPTYTIATYTGTLTGTFAGGDNLPEDWSIEYGTRSNSKITLMPEPATLALLGLGGLGLLLGRKRR